MSRDRDRLFEIVKKCIRTGTFTLASGKQSNFYFDAKEILLTTEGSALASKVILETLLDPSVTALGGLTSGADPIVSGVGVLAHLFHRPLKLFYVRKEAKGHGTKKHMEGPPLTAEDRVAIVEDVVTTGKSATIAIDRVTEETGAKIAQVIALVDRQEGGREAFGDKLVSVFTRADFGVPPDPK
jgi:orotate phosphoribosyltransferase